MENIIETIISSPTWYGRFLNTLSLMEYTGAKKIIKSQALVHIDKKMLDHITEEMRHAQILKRAAIKMLPECHNYTAEALLCGAEAYAYFQTVDYASVQALGVSDPWHAYLYTTFLIETRVLTFYAAFTDALKSMGKASIFRSILIEEEKHLEEVLESIKKLPNHEENMQLLKVIEENAFNKFLSVLGKAVLNTSNGP